MAMGGKWGYLYGANTAAGEGGEGGGCRGLESRALVRGAAMAMGGKWG